MAARKLRGRYTDSCFAWVIVLGSFLVSVGQAANGLAITVLLDPFLQYFQETQAMLGILSAIRMFIFQGSGLIAGPLVQRFGPRLVAMCGILLCATGTISASVTTEFYQLIITFCIIAGLGAGFLFIPASVVVHQYHEKNRALAAGVASSGLSLATCVFPPMMRLTLDAYGWRGCLVFISAVCMQCLAGAMLFMPNPPMSQNKSSHKMLDDDDVEIQYDNEAVEEIGSHESNPSVPDTENNFCDIIKVFKNKLFILFILAVIPIQSGASVYIYLCIQRAIDQHVNPLRAAFIPTAFGVCSFTGRLVSGYLGDCGSVNRLMQMSLSVIAAAVVMAASVFCGRHLIAHLALGAGYGLCFGLTMGVFSTVQVDLVGVEMLPTAMSIAEFSRAVASLSVVPLAGLLIDVTGSYTASFLTGSTLQMFGGLIVLFIAIVKRQQKAHS